ncbi:MAG: FAD-binding oxidoreductase, partial [Chloroflexales bacterium]|nr:FAD-binding oxidoreductase [Chloroflexales bacterium]
DLWLRDLGELRRLEPLAEDAEFRRQWREVKLRAKRSLAALVPQLANLATQAPGLRAIAKLVAGVAPERAVPAFAPETFKAWFRRHRRERGALEAPKGRVILWPDTFNNHFHPATAAAAVEVLEAAGYAVDVPDQWLCCGRPLYDYGMLTLAKKLLQEIIAALRDDIRAGTPLIGLEPSCTAVFRDELGNLFPHDEDARRLSRQTYTLGEFLAREGYAPPQLHARAVVHGHCHHKAILGMDHEEAVLGGMGLSVEVLDSGCCGMAGSFGFERGAKYDLSVRRGEQLLLPKVREAAPDTLIIADGFSCKEQIAQGTGRRALHLAQVLQLTLHMDGGLPLGPYPEERAEGLHRPRAWPALARSLAVAGIGTLVVGGALGWATRQLIKGAKV